MSAVACKSCAFFENKTTVETGVCRFNPPVFLTEAEQAASWPTVKSDDWCGQFSNEKTQH